MVVGLERDPTLSSSTTMEATTLHQIQSFPSHAHGIIQSTAASVSPPPRHRTSQPCSSSMLTSQPFSLHYYLLEDGADKATEASLLCSATQEAKDSNTKDDAKNGDDDGKPDIDIFISNVVCTFSVRCHLNLKRIGMEGRNVEYKREAGKVLMKLRKPYCTATIWSSGKITVTGNSSESDAKMCARRIARQLQKLGFRVHFHQFQVVNVLGTCRLPFAIRIAQFSEGIHKVQAKDGTILVLFSSQL
ncbi:putative TATA box-binding protein-like protein 1 [Apostichopus japonicus]|uniref:Putative TATA box-binding protein-like protein 1 n=1 Tax=Stichopus japonicus TaxID=307972 RepID=A0A2G8KJJ3_STIJA|nr:putative TATA box-binding protein-like protein 1 [Apostichopus japonicus]